MDYALCVCYLVNYSDTCLQERELHSPTYPDKCSLLFSTDDIYHDIVFEDNCNSSNSKLLEQDQHPQFANTSGMPFSNSNSDLIGLQPVSPSPSRPISQDFIAYNITPVNTFSNNSEITIHTLNFNSTYSDVSPRHSHHFSDDLLVPKKVTKVVNSVTSDNRYHLRGNSVTHNITVC